MLVFTDAVALWFARFLRAIDVTTHAIDVTTAGLLTQFFPYCTFAIRSFSQVSAIPGYVHFYCDLAWQTYDEHNKQTAQTLSYLLCLCAPLT